MKLFYAVIFLLSLASAAFAREEPVLARVTSYWANEGASGLYASTGGRLRSGHCAVDPTRIPYGSSVVFPDRACTAVDTGSAVISRKAARSSGRTVTQRNAIVIDRFFETKRKAMAWAENHPHFMTVWIIPPGLASTQKGSQRPNADRKVAELSPPSIAPQQPNRTAATATSEPTLRYARRRG